MTTETMNYVKEKSLELIAAPSCCAEAKSAAQAWIAACGTASLAEETKKYITELEEDIESIDDLIAFAGSDFGKKVFGEKSAAAVLEHAKEIKASGAKYCDCPACAAVKAILDKKADMLK